MYVPGAHTGQKNVRYPLEQESQRSCATTRMLGIEPTSSGRAIFKCVCVCVCVGDIHTVPSEARRWWYTPSAVFSVCVTHPLWVM